MLTIAPLKPNSSCVVATHIISTSYFTFANSFKKLTKTATPALLSSDFDETNSFCNSVQSALKVIISPILRTSLACPSDIPISIYKFSNFIGFFDSSSSIKWAGLAPITPNIFFFPCIMTSWESNIRGSTPPTDINLINPFLSISVIIKPISSI